MRLEDADPLKVTIVVGVVLAIVLGGAFTFFLPEHEKRDRYGNCYHEPVNEMGESNICHQYCSPQGLHGYDTKKGQLLVCVCNDPKETESE